MLERWRKMCIVVVVVVSVIKSACPGLLLPSTCHFQRKRFSSFKYFCYQLHSHNFPALSAPLTVPGLIYFLWFLCSQLRLHSSALSRMNFPKTNFFHFLRRRKLFALNSWFIQHWLVLFCFVFTLESFFRHTKKPAMRENFNVFPTHTGTAFPRAEILFAFFFLSKS